MQKARLFVPNLAFETFDLLSEKGNPNAEFNRNQRSE